MKYFVASSLVTTFLFGIYLATSSFTGAEIGIRQICTFLR